MGNMARVIFLDEKQRDFVETVCSKTNLDSESLAKICGVHGRTFRDWRRGKHRLSLSAAMKLSEFSGVPLPVEAKIVDEYEHTRRAAQLGAPRRSELYGNPGTAEGRRKGGLNSCKRQQELGSQGIPSKFIVRKKVNLPQESEELAEAIGIILGDGSITQFQVTVSVSALVDCEYADFIKQLFERLFQIEVVRQPIRTNTIALTMSSRSLVDFFIEKGLVKGDKVRQQVDIPPWVKAEPKFLKACIRGLFDTDGSVYFHRHRCQGRDYLNVGTLFTSFSPPLCNSFYQFLTSEGYSAKLTRGTRVYLYRASEVARYLQEVGTHNPKHIERFNRYLNRRSVINNNGSERCESGRFGVPGEHV